MGCTGRAWLFLVLLVAAVGGQDCYSGSGALSDTCLRRLFSASEVAAVDGMLDSLETRLSNLSERLHGLRRGGPGCSAATEEWRWELTYNLVGARWKRWTDAVPQCPACVPTPRHWPEFGPRLPELIHNCSVYAHCAHHECVELTLDIRGSAGAYLRPAVLGTAQLCCWSDGDRSCDSEAYYVESGQMWLGAALVGVCHLLALVAWAAGLCCSGSGNEEREDLEELLKMGKLQVERQKLCREQTDRWLANWAFKVALNDEMTAAYVGLEHELKRYGNIVDREDMENWNFFQWQTDYKPKRKLYHLIDLTHWLNYAKLVKNHLQDFFRVKEKDPQYDTILNVKSFGDGGPDEGATPPPKGPSSKFVPEDGDSQDGSSQPPGRRPSDEVIQDPTPPSKSNRLAPAFPATPATDPTPLSQSSHTFAAKPLSIKRK